SLKGSLFTAFTAAGIFAIVSLLALPQVMNYETNLRYQGSLYKLAEKHANEYAGKGEWEDTLIFLRICEKIWPKGPGIEKFIQDAEIELENALFPRPVEKNTENAGPEQEPLNAAEALAMAEIAMKEERYFDAHWLAVLAGKIAGPGSAETAAASRMASRAWSAVNSMEANSRETEAYRIYRLKRDGYEALINEDWILAYYIFLELRQLSPRDPDGEKYFSISEQGCANVAFFDDELDFAIGSTLTGNVFSLPYGRGRIVIRFDSLSLYPDVAYGAGMEILAFDRDARPAWVMEAPYVKLRPIAPGGGRAGSETRVSLISRTIHRTDKNLSWEPVVQGMGEPPPSGTTLVLEAEWKDFLLLSDLYKGKNYFSVKELIDAAEVGAKYGYLHEVFEVELLRRFAHQLIFMVMAIMTLRAGWYYRAQKKSFYIFLPMMAVLPVVYNGMVHIIRSGTNNIVIWMVVTFGFGTACVLFGMVSVVVLIVSMIILVAQKS
ncbi:MAG: hypothetical protein LBH43_11145, partial [Treponema sp.]|nr:hypothetical protein [Treponema sp.]